MATIGGPNLDEKYYQYLDRVKQDGGEYKLPNAKEIQPELDNILELNPSLVLIPTAGKSGKLYSIVPSDGSGDFDFSRNGTATYLTKNGLIETAGVNEPRIEVESDGSFKGVLVEPAATNFMLFSDNLGNFLSPESNNSTAVTTQIQSVELGLKTESTNFINYVVTDGVVLDISGGNGSSIYTGTFNQIGGTQVSISCYVKYNGYSSVYIGNGTSSNLSGFRGCVFNFNTETIERFNTTLVTNEKFERLSNGWFRISCSFITVSSNVMFGVGALPDGTVGDGIKGIYLFGFQIELGTVATSYIPTFGSQVTRPADFIARLNAQNLIGQEKGSIYYKFDISDNTQSKQRELLLIYSSFGYYLLRLRLVPNKIVFAYFNVDEGMTGAGAFGGQNTIGSVNKFLFSYNYFTNRVRIYLNGAKLLDIINPILLPRLQNTITLGSLVNQHHANDNSKNLSLFKTELTDDQAINLTKL